MPAGACSGRALCVADGSWAGKTVQVRSGVVVELKRPCERVEHLLGRMLVSALLEPYVVVSADARQQGHFLAAQAGNSPPAADVWEGDVLGTDQFTPGPEVLANQVGGTAQHNDTPVAALNLALPLPGSTGLLSARAPRRTLAPMRDSTMSPPASSRPRSDSTRPPPR